MKEFINKFKYSIGYITIMLFLSLIFTILEYIGLSYTFSITFLSIINFILVFIYSLLNGYNSSLKGYISGFRSGVKIWLILLFINILTFNSFTLKLLLYYLLLMIISIFGGIFGKNKQKNCPN